jgi:hypothetical protein
MNSTAFPSGMHYFEMTRRMFAFEHPCANCVAVHNNWLVGTDAKMYRWGRWWCREAVLWAIVVALGHVKRDRLWLGSLLLVPL